MINETDFLNELNSFLEEENAKALNIEQDADNNYLINDMHQANYFIGLSKQCDDEIDQIRLFIAEERDRLLKQLDDFEQQQIESIKKKQLYFNRALEDYTRRELEKSNKKSIKLPSGTLSVKKQQAHYEYDDIAVIEWAQVHYPSLLKVTVPEPKTSIDKKELKKITSINNGALYLNGVMVPGIEVTEKEDAFSIK